MLDNPIPYCSYTDPIRAAKESTLSAAMSILSVKDCKLWRHLNKAFHDSEYADIAVTLAGNLPSICQEAQTRMRAFPSLHPQYTLHDATHLLRVTELMGRLIPDAVLKILNPVEIALLILAAHFHDQGMVLDRDEIQNLRVNPAFQVFRADWEIDHPNLLQIKRELGSKSISEERAQVCRLLEYQLEAALLTDFVRVTHGERSASFVRETFGSDRRWNVAGTNISDLVARLCASHTMPAAMINGANGYNFDESVGPFLVNMPFLAVVLRVADLLDFDRERTPDSLYQAIHFTSSVSVTEWEKHRSVTGWVIDRNMIRFTMQCEHPVYQRAAYQFMNQIDFELRDTHALLRDAPEFVSSYHLIIPESVDRSRITAKNNSYLYHDLEFSLSRDEVVKLFMTDDLYGSPALCVRELLQNSLDALRLRQALIKRDNETDWPIGKVTLEHTLNADGYSVLRCTDNGAGMDAEIVTKYLTKVGRSYYRSPEFDHERLSFKQAGVDYDPCAQFGIGFMSCFMLGDHIVIRTRRDLGPNKGWGEPLVIEINGVDGMLVMRKGQQSQEIGTTIEVTSRDKPRMLTKWDDRIQLIDVLNLYALACEFPIEATCSVPGIEGHVMVETNFTKPETFMSCSDEPTCEILEQDLNDIDSRLRGTVRTVILVDQSGNPTLDSGSLRWVRSEKHYSLEIDSSTYATSNLIVESATCLDGIFVCGNFHHNHIPIGLGIYSNVFELGLDSFLVDVRGELKPPITPARVPPNRLQSVSSWSTRSPRWTRVQHLVNAARGRIWERIAHRLDDNRLDPSIFWQLVTIYDFHPRWMRANAIWSFVRIPLLRDDSFAWRRLPEIGALTVKVHDTGDRREISLETVEGERLLVPAHIVGWEREHHAYRVQNELETLVSSMCTVVLDKDTARLELYVPDEPAKSPAEFSPEWSSYLLPYDGNLRETLVAFTGITTANRSHPLVQAALRERYQEPESFLWQFMMSLIGFLSRNGAQTAYDYQTEIEFERKHLGYLFTQVDWFRYPDEIRPPFQVRLADGSTTYLDKELLEYWASSSVRLDE